MNEENPKPGASVGRGMLTIMWLIVLGMLTFFFARWEDDKYNPNASINSTDGNGQRTIVLKQNNWGHYVATGHINGKPVTFMLDTGATSVAVPQKLASELGLRPGPRYQVSTANGLVEVRATKIKNLTLGNIVFHDVPAAINPGMQDDEILLGMSALKHVDFKQTGNELSITQYK